jgi:epoxyqueuosine reductase
LTSILTAQVIRDNALAFGYDDCGIIPVSDLRGYADRLAERLNRFPEMLGSFEHLADFAFPDRHFLWARSVVVCAVWYGRYRLPTNLKGRIGKNYQTDMRPEPRSIGHQAGQRLGVFLRERGLQVASGSLFPLSSGLAPLRWAAMKAGIGVVGKNNFLYTERGSWICLEAWLIDAEMELKLTPTAPLCDESCNLCEQACPTGALAGAYAMNAVTCISRRTTRIGVRVDDPLAGRFGNWIYGCDVCQDICPRNSGAWREDDDFPGLSEMADGLSLEALVSAEYASLREKISARLFYIGEDELWKWKTNTLNAMRNGWSEAYRPTVERARHDENEFVRAFAEAILRERPASL